ncbi:MAG: peroxiredoxin family protein [Crocinitomicaceae bacterium]
MLQIKNILFIFLSLICFDSLATTNPENNQIENGDWYFKLNITKHCYIPILGTIQNNVLTINNGIERINLEPFRAVEGDLIANFSLYHSSVVITKSSSKSLSGYWKNYNRKGNYKIKFTAIKKKPRLKKNKKTLRRLDGKWEATIQYGKSTNLVGDFKFADNQLHGTFRSETGDYRYLAGHAIKDSLFLSCFDGTHCYLFTGRLHKNDSISGQFFSGNHYKTTWTAIKNPNVTLRDPDSLTFLATKDPISFALPSTNNKIISYDSLRLKSKPVIIQIFGSWCPNCVDETHFLNTLSTKYGDNINIVGIGFEMGHSEEDKMNHLIKFKKKMNVKYPLLLGGTADKKQAGKIFPMLNHVMSFPTLLVVNPDGKIVKIHTGFNGPATGAHYENFKSEMDRLLDDLVNI